MSGGVDSSVAALVLKEAGYDVFGLSMRLYQCPLEGTSGCCTASDRNDARAVCGILGIPHEVIEETDAFRHKVIEPFIRDYLDGRTPSPCTWCNRFLKFPILLEKMRSLDADWIATGHYARVERGKDGRARLLRAVDEVKDQSYFLFPMGREELKRLLLPVGSWTKDEVRRKARANGLPVTDKPESQEICFVSDGDYVSYIENSAGERLGGPGRFVDQEGNVLGTHRGIHAYTIGQRKGLGLGGGPKRHVLRIDALKNQVVLGDVEDLASDHCVVAQTLWLDPAAEAQVDAGESLSVTVKVRSRHKGVSAAVEKINLEKINLGRVRVLFERPVSSVAPGQAAVFYDREQVLGGGWIE